MTGADPAGNAADWTLHLVEVHDAGALRRAKERIRS